MKFICFIFLTSLSALAQDYSLYQAENDHFRDYSREQLMERIGVSSALLPNYSCNGRDELDPFWPAIRQNENVTSLQIKLYKSGAYFKLNGELQTDFTNVFNKI